MRAGQLEVSGATVPAWHATATADSPTKLHATCYMQHATCYLLDATCYMLHATCGATVPAWHATATVPADSLTKLHATCYMLSEFQKRANRANLLVLIFPGRC